MSTTTSNLGLFKYTEADHSQPFDYKEALNNNWDKIDNANFIQNKTGGYYNINIGDNLTIGEGAENTIVLGNNATSTTSSQNSVAIGEKAKVGGVNSVVIGYNTEATGSYNIAIGSNAKFSTASVNSAIQLGSGTNSTSKTLKVGNYTLLDTSTGLIPDARISNNIVKSVNSTTPDANGNVNVESGSARNLGEIVESKVPITDAGLHQLDGSVVWEDGIYGDFVTHMKALYYNNSPCFIKGNTTVTKKNYIDLGATIDGTVLSGFTQSTHAALPAINTLPTTSWELILKVKQTTLTTNSSITEAPASMKGIILRVTNASTGAITCWMASGATNSWNICNQFATGLTLTADTWTYIRVYWDGTTYTFSQSNTRGNWTNGNTVNSTLVPPFDQYTINLGGASWENYPFNNGQIDLNGSDLYIDNQPAWYGYSSTSMQPHQYYNYLVEKTGNCNKFILTSDLTTTQVSLWRQISVTNNTGWINGAFNDGQVDTTYPIAIVDEQIKVGTYLYAVRQGYSYYFKTNVYIESITGSDSSTVYNLSPIEYNNQTYNYHLYYSDYLQSTTKNVLNLGIKLPTCSNEQRYLVKSYSSGSNWYRIYSDGFCEQGGISNNTALGCQVTFLIPFLNTNYSVTHGNSDLDGTAGVVNVAFRAKYTTGFIWDSGYNGTFYSAELDWKADGYIDMTHIDNTPLYQYICMGTTTKTEIESDIDQIANDLARKIDKSDTVDVHVVTETYNSGGDWYRVYSDGWCEQGGSFITGGTSQTVNITFFKPFVNTRYHITTTYHRSDATQLGAAIPVSNSISTTGFGVVVGIYTQGFYWEAKGYINEEA